MLLTFLRSLLFGCYIEADFCQLFGRVQQLTLHRVGLNETRGKSVTGNKNKNKIANDSFLQKEKKTSSQND